MQAVIPSLSPSSAAAAPQPQARGPPGPGSVSSSSDSAAAGLLTWLLPLLFAVTILPLVVCVCVKRRHRIKAAMRQPVGEPQVLAARADSTDSSSSSSPLGPPGGMAGAFHGGLDAFRRGALAGGKPAPVGAVQLPARLGGSSDAGCRDDAGLETEAGGRHHHTHFFTVASTQSSPGTLGALDSSRDLSAAEGAARVHLTRVSHEAHATHATHAYVSGTKQDRQGTTAHDRSGSE